MKRVLLLGAQGQVGQALAAETLPSGWELAAYGRAKGDIADHRGIQNLLLSVKPDIVINAAAMTHVDQCEREVEKATDINFRAVANLAAQCSALDLPLIHLSTDYVFDGKEQTEPYPTDAQMSPLNVYADTKMMGEIALQHELAWHVIVRVSLVFSAFGTNLLTRTLAMLAKNDEVKIVTDQTSCPTYAPDLAKALITIAEGLLRGQHGGFGLFHYCGEPAVTRFDFAQAIMDEFTSYTGKRPRILPAASADFPGFAERPAYSALDCSKIREIYGIEQKPWREGLKEAIAQLHTQGRLPV